MVDRTKGEGRKIKVEMAKKGQAMSFSYYTRWLSPTFRRQLAWLRERKPLPKVHYYWALPDSALAQPDERVYEYVRISRAACVQAEYATQAQIETCVRLCHKANATTGLSMMLVPNADGTITNPIPVT